MAVPKRKVNVKRLYNIKVLRQYGRCCFCKSKILFKGLAVCYSCLKS